MVGQEFPYHYGVEDHSHVQQVRTKEIHTFNKEEVEMIFAGETVVGQ